MHIKLASLFAALIWVAGVSVGSGGEPRSKAMFKIQVNENGQVTAVAPVGSTANAPAVDPNMQQASALPQSQAAPALVQANPAKNAVNPATLGFSQDGAIPIAGRVFSKGVTTEGLFEGPSTDEVKLAADGLQSPLLHDNDKIRADAGGPSPMATVIVANETFESSFPNGLWAVTRNSGYTDAVWDDCSYRPYAGAWSAWCADGGTQGTTPGYGYKANMKTWMTYGPFDLRNTSAANMTFRYWLSTESGYDYFKFGASLDDIDYPSMTALSGSSGGWINRTLDLSSYLGQSSVYVSFLFTSDGSTQYEGAYVDNVVITKQTVDLPNLYWSTIDVPDIWTVGQSVTATITETNKGAGYAGAHHTQLYLSADSALTTSDLPLGAKAAVGAISGYTPRSFNVTFTVPSVGAGTYYIGAMVDADNEVYESNESDNGGTRTGTIDIIYNYPNLYWHTISTSSDTWTVGQSITATITETNKDSGYAGAHHTQLYLSDNDILSTLDTPLGAKTAVAGISSRSTRSFSVTFAAPSVSAGTYYIGAMVDIDNEVVESDESDNGGTRISTIDISYPIYPNLYWSTIDVPDIWTVGQSVTATITETNKDSGYAGAHHTQLYLSSDSVLTTSDLPLGAKTAVVGISGGGTRSFSVTFTAPSVNAGTYYIGAMVDTDNEVVESNESDNGGTRTGMITVSPIIQYGSLRVTLLPADAVLKGARWQVDGGPDQVSGATVSGLTAGNHTVSFKSVTGYITPVNQTVAIQANLTTMTTGTYIPVQTGNLQATLQPADAISKGAQWQVDNSGAWQNSGVTVTGLSVGNHTVSFKSVTGYTAPANQTVTILANQTTMTTGTYQPIQAPITATHSAPNYTAGANLTVSCTVTVPTGRTLQSLLWTVALPAGWNLQSVSGDGTPQAMGNEILFTGSLNKALLSFSYVVSVPAGTTGAQSIGGIAGYQLDGMINPAQVNSDPNPMMVNPGLIVHSADYEPPQWVISGVEASRVLAYWRMGAYHVEAAGLDGYAPGAGSQAEQRHSADYAQPYWAINAEEASRVLAYWRAGGYHPDAGGLDGYAPGPATFGIMSAAEKTSVGLVAAHTTAPNYKAGQTLSVTNTITVSSGTLLSLTLTPVLPTGWTLISARGDGSPEAQYGQILLTGTLTSQMKVIYDVNVPSGATETVSLQTGVSAFFAGQLNPTQQKAQPDSLVVRPQSDDLRINIARAVEIYWLSQAGAKYTVQYTLDVVNGPWVDLYIDITGTGLEMSVFDRARTSETRIYQVIKTAP